MQLLDQHLGRRGLFSFFLECVRGLQRRHDFLTAYRCLRKEQKIGTAIWVLSTQISTPRGGYDLPPLIKKSQILGPFLVQHWEKWAESKETKRRKHKSSCGTANGDLRRCAWRQPENELGKYFAERKKA